MFGQNLDVQLNSARTEDTTVVWKNFHDSITLIVLSSEEGTSELRLERMLHMVFGAMVRLGPFFSKTQESCTPSLFSLVQTCIFFSHPDIQTSALFPHT